MTFTFGSLFCHDVLCDRVSVTCSVVWCKQWGTWVEGNQTESFSLVGRTCNLPLSVNMTTCSSRAVFPRKEWETESPAVGWHARFPWSFSPVQCCSCRCRWRSMRVRLAPLDVKRCLCPATGAVALTCARHIYSPLSHWVSSWSRGSGAPPPHVKEHGGAGQLPDVLVIVVEHLEKMGDSHACVDPSYIGDPEPSLPLQVKDDVTDAVWIETEPPSDYAHHLVVDFTQQFPGDVDIGEEVLNFRQGHLPDGWCLLPPTSQPTPPTTHTHTPNLIKLK